jgi:hypothetical protein
MDARSLPEALNLIMKQRAWKQDDLTGELGVSQVWVSLASRGKRDPGIARTAGYLDRVGWEIRICPKKEDEDPVKRREFVAGVASVTLVPSTKIGPYQDPEFVRQLTGRHAKARLEHGGNALAMTAIRHLRGIEPAVTGSDRRLQAAASDLACETVWTLNDARRFDAGEHAGRLGLELARRSGDSDAESRAYSALSAINQDRGRIDRAVIYAQRGVNVRDVPSPQRSWMTLRLGRSLGLVRGHERAARDIVDGVHGFLDDAKTNGSLAQIEAADMHASLGMALHDLRVYDEAQSLLHEGVRLACDRSPFIEAFCLGQQVMTAMQARDPEFAADRMYEFSRLVPLVSSSRVDKYGAEILEHSGQWANIPEIRAARSQLRAVVPA